MSESHEMTMRGMLDKILSASRHLIECDFHPAMSPHVSCPDCRKAREAIEGCSAWFEAEKVGAIS